MLWLLNCAHGLSRIPQVLGTGQVRQVEFAEEARSVNFDQLEVCCRAYELVGMLLTFFGFRKVGSGTRAGAGLAVTVLGC